MDAEYTSKNFDNLGIVSVICDEIEIDKTLDNLIPPDPQMTITLGECLKLMIINGLGFTSRPLYLELNFLIVDLFNDFWEENALVKSMRSLRKISRSILQIWL